MLVAGIDTTPQARDALALARRLADALDTELIAAYVHSVQELERFFTGPQMGDAAQLVGQQAQGILDEVRRLADVAGAQLRVVPASSASAGLQALAAETEAQLVVVGSSSRSGVGRVLPGGTADRLLSGSPVPVVIAPSGYAADDRALGVIGCGFDTSPEAREALQLAAELARAAGARVRLVAVHRRYAFDQIPAGTFGVQSVADEAHRRLRESVDEASAALGDDVSAEGEVVDGDPAQVLSEQSADLDLLVLGSRGYGPLRSVLVGSVSSAVIRDAACPVAVVPRSD